jgi:sugar O-acyltransferase (sialic acid O-acetyltransferase NeuD family)
MKQKIIIAGDSAFAEIACLYFEQDYDYEVVAFAVERAYFKRDQVMERPVIAFEELPARFAPAEHKVFVAATYTQLNRLRERLSAQAKSWGYELASYVSPHAFIAKNAKLGEHCFIFENNVVQPFVTIGDDVVLWSGNHIGHHSTVESHCFISSHVVISGYVRVGHHSFLGVNSTISNNVTMGADCWLGPAVVVTKDLPEGSLVKPHEFPVSPVSSYRFLKLPVPTTVQTAATTQV